MISAAENSNNFMGFWKEKSVEDVVTLGPTAPVTLITYSKGRQKLPLNPSRHPTGWTFHPSRHPSI